MRRLVIASGVALLAACASPPKPPVVDGLSRKPVNNAGTNEILRLRAELAAAREELRVRVVPPVAPEPPAPVPVVALPPRSTTITVLYPYNSTRFMPTVDQTAKITPFLTIPGRITVRGRTDGMRASPGDERVALMRAISAKNYLVALGVPDSDITVNYLSAGDYVADNSTLEGRALNRRVEIEFTNEGAGS